MINEQSSKLVQNIKQLNIEIEQLLGEPNLSKIEKMFNQYNVITEAFYTLKSTYYFMIQHYESGINLLKTAKDEYPFSYNVHYNSAMLNHMLNNYEDCIYDFAKCVKLASNEEEKERATTSFEEMLAFLRNNKNITSDKLTLILKRSKEILREGDERSYPINRYGESIIRSIMEKNSGDDYLVNMYRSFQVYDVDSSTRFYFKTELLKGLKTKNYTINLDSPSTFPISFFKKPASLQVSTEKRSYFFEETAFPNNQFNYLTFEEKGKIDIKSSDDIFIGNPIALEAKKLSPKIVLYIFIDGLSFDFVDKYDLEKIMPNTYKFFRYGYINKNCYTTGEWTLPSVASIYTGKYTLNHGLHHPTYHLDLHKQNKLFSEDFKHAGYMTTQINNNWRVTPTYGYHKGFDRIIYQNFLGGFHCGDVISETIEHIEAFKNQNHFMWISLEDLHDVPDELQNDLISQISVNAKYRQTKIIDETSVLTNHDTNKIEKYYSEIQRIDKHLGTLFNYIETEFTKDDVLIVLNSDHGQSFLENSSFLLHESRRRVPLMMYGKGIEQKESSEYVEIVDIMPTLLNICDIHFDTKEIDGNIIYDFGGKKRNFVTTEAFHPNQTFKVVITDNEHIFHFETVDLVNNNGFVDLEKYYVKLINKITQKDEVANNQEKVNKYVNYIITRSLKVLKS